MKLIVITTDSLIDRECVVLNKLFAQGMPTLHLRKPLATVGNVEQLLLGVDPAYYNRIVLHDHFILADRFHLKGIHLNRRNPDRPPFKISSVSCSCHSIDCIASSNNRFDYLFLSPIFDSISKSGYAHGFSNVELQEASHRGVINEKIVALGGVEGRTMPLAAQYGFGGVAVLGALWGNFANDRDEYALAKRFDLLNALTHQL